jgi:AcrR family transcriptional regulator
MENYTEAEKNIVNAARQVFYKKGFKNATMRDIASEANTNLAMVNYYFRSKENLFNIIFDETWAVLSNKIKRNIGNEETNIEKKIEGLVNDYFDVFMENPYIPIFIMREVIGNPGNIALRINEQVKKHDVLKTFNRQVEEEVKSGKIKPVSGFSIFINLHSLVIFPILARPIFQHTLNISSLELEELMAARKQEVTEILVNSIRL